MAEGLVSPWWLIMAYAVISLGELMLSPMGLSLVSKVAPERMRGLTPKHEPSTRSAVDLPCQLVVRRS